MLGLYFGTQVSLVVACWLSSCSMDLVASSHPHHPIPSQYNVGVSCVFFFLSFPDGSVGKESACNAGDTGDVDLMPLSGKSPEGENSNTLQYCWLGNPKDRGAW